MKKHIMGFPLSQGSYKNMEEDIVQLAARSDGGYVCVANVHMFMEAKKDPEFTSVVRSADIVTPDGRPLVWALKLLHGIEQDRVTGMDLMPDLLTSMEENGVSAYFYGGTPDMAVRTRVYLQQNHPNLKIAGVCSPPFGPSTGRWDDQVEAEVNANLPCIVFVVLGCPKQEKWMASMRDRVNAVMIGVGGALPVMLGMQRRAPVWMQDAGLEWFYRLCQEPRRLFKRYSTTNTMFLGIFLKELFKLRIQAPTARAMDQLAEGLQGVVGSVKQRVVILSDTFIPANLYRHLEDGKGRFEIVGIFANDVHELTHYPVLGRVSDFPGFAMANRVDAVFSLMPETSSPVISDICKMAKRLFIRFHYVHDFGLNRNRQHAEVNPSGKLVMETDSWPVEKRSSRFFKRSLDILVSLAGVVLVLSWLMPLLSLLIVLSSPGPPLYVQRRTGRRGKAFSCLKFRTLRASPDADLRQVSRGDSRVTKLGAILRRTNLDELPQLLNVLMGDMSIVGPRPHMLHHTDEFSMKVEDYMVRHWLKPGITGLAQVNGYRGEVFNDEHIRGRVDADLWYLEHWTFGMDLRIIWRTIRLCLKGDEKAY